MEKSPKKIQLEKATDKEKYELVRQLRVKAAEMAKRADAESRKADRALYEHWYGRS